LSAPPYETFGFNPVAYLFGCVGIKEGIVFFIGPVPEYLTIDFGTRHLTEELAVRTLEDVGVARRIMGQLIHGGICIV